MKKNDRIELRSKTKDELIKQLRDLRSESVKLSMEMTTGKVANTAELYNKKKMIARILTYLGQKSTVTEVTADKKEETVNA